MIILILNGGFATESTTVAVPSSELGPPHPSPQASVFPPRNQRGGGTHSPVGEGVGVSIRTPREKA
jgi:hypothetical protein